jgi:hypothetical protein
VRYGLQSHDLYHLPLGFRPESDNWKASIIAATEGWTVYDAIADPDLVRGIIDLVAADETLDIGEATLLFRSTGDLRDSLGEHSDVRPMGAEQSNTSAVIDERLALKVYRRIEAGMNPELEILRFLTERGFEHIAALEGYISYEGRPLEATLAICSNHSVQRTAGSFRLTRSLRIRLLPAHPPGEVTAELHALASIRSTSTSRLRSPAPRRSRSSPLRSTRRSSRCSQPYPTSRRSCAAAKRSAGRAHAHRGVGVIRHHGDYHQARRSDRTGLADDFEGEPLRCRTGGARRRGMGCCALRLGVGDPAQRGTTEGWRSAARVRGLPGHRRAALLPPDRKSIERLLTVFELEKAVYEIRLGNRPDRSRPGRRDSPHARAGTMRIGELDLHCGRGRHERIYERLGAHARRGVSFAVWAPNARGLVVGDWNRWDGRENPLELLGSSASGRGRTEASEGDGYKYEVHGADGSCASRPTLCRYAEVPPKTASRSQVALRVEPPGSSGCRPRSR